ncbi:MAG: glycoside hydrolase family 9 protein [Acidobacteriia bacterium]|nr:glycoside hydrolase family 9 protein [Terriglobia bacterium]
MKKQLFSFLLALVALPAVCASDTKISLNEKEYFEAPGFSFLVFHNNYQVGHQGGLQMIQNGERLLDSGDLFLLPKAGQLGAELHILRRVADREKSTATVFGEIAGGAGYRLFCHTDGAHILITLKLDQAVDWSRFDAAGFRMAVYPGAYFLKSFQGDSGAGIFPRQYTGEQLAPSTHRLLMAQEDPLRSVLVTRSDGDLVLMDERRGGPEDWFEIVAPLKPGSGDTEVNVAITPSIDAAWRRPAVIGISEAGYHPSQTKRAILELDRRDAVGASVTLYRMQLNGGKKVAKSGVARPWGQFLRYRYEVFDFSDVREPGVYVIESRGQTAGPFPIDAGIYAAAWRPTLQYFLPVQMCHVAVKEGNRTWHGACHLDDALQAPEGKVYIDSYQQGKRETRFADNEHIPGLDWGGWHDAGDHDLPAGSIAITTLALALAQEEFHPKLDETSVNRTKREVLLHVPDGKQDLIQQIEYGVEGLLASFRVGGHIFPGIIESTPHAYSHLGDPVNITDNRIWDGRAETFDDRWVFTNRNTGLQYETVQALAAASRVLGESNATLASACQAAARKLYDYEQEHAPVYAPSAYAPSDSGFRSEEVSASVEMLLTTGESRYRDRLLALLPELRKISGEKFASGPGWTLVRALARVPNGEFQSTVRDLAKKWKVQAEKTAAANPYGVHLQEGILNPDYRLETRSEVSSGFVWGPGWDLQDDALHQYYFHKHLPELFDADPLLATVNFVLGCHPGSNESYVSGVGANSAIIAYGFNRADWSHIPGGVISGASLVKPDYMELKEFPFLWYQTEYVIGGAATYIFDVLAANKLLNEK